MYNKDDRYVKMHDLIRDMAIQKLRERSSIMVKAGAQLEEVPGVDEWIDSLVRVSLMENDIEEIPSGHSPRCPKLSTLLLGSNTELRLIADSFFEQLHELKVLVLSDTVIAKLPDSISKLVSLIALLLNNCENLQYIPSLAKLTKLQKLDLSVTGLEKLPEGMELLSNLRYLNLWRSKVKEIPIGILPNLSHLQVLILNKFDYINEKRISVTGKEVGCLRKLESLECNFKGFSDFRECMEHLSLCTYNILIGRFIGHTGHMSKRSVCLTECCISMEQDFKAFPEDIEELIMRYCRFPGITLFGDSSESLRCLMKLKIIRLEYCDGIKSLLSSNILRSLKTLRVDGFISILPPLQSVGLFFCLKYFIIEGCHGLKRLFPIGLLSTLQNLEIIQVWHCISVEEIQATEEDEKGRWKQNNSGSRNFSVECIRLPKLKTLSLRDLPELKSICSGVMICDSLQHIEIVNCPNLKRMPLHDPPPSLQTITAYPERQEFVSWDELSDKILLQPFSDFQLWQ